MILICLISMKKTEENTDFLTEQSNITYTEKETELLSDNTVKQPFSTIIINSKIYDVIPFVWLSGIALLIIYALISYIRIHRNVQEAMRKDGNIYISSRIDTPFISGIIFPKIYLPEFLNTQEYEMILAHEQEHIKHGDQLIKPFAFLILMLHWFNPLVWVSYYLFCRDVEIACDERVISRLGTDKKKTYASVLLQCSLPRELSGITPLSFGETAVKERIGRIINYRKPSKKSTVLCCALIMAITAASCVSESPVNVEQSSKANPETTSEESSEAPLEVKNFDDPDVINKIKDNMAEEAAENNGVIDLEVWCSADDGKFEKAFVKQFKEKYADSRYNFNIKINFAFGEDKAGGKIIEYPQNGADVFAFSDDYLPILVKNNVIAPVDKLFMDNVKSENISSCIDVCKVGDELYAFPKSSGSGYYLYYDKRVFKSEEDVRELDRMIEIADAAGKNVYINLGNAYYNFAFFSAAGCDISYDTISGRQTADLDNNEGLNAAKAMCHIAEKNSSGFIGSPGNSGESTPIIQGWFFDEGGIAAQITGSWDGSAIRHAIGEENVGVAKLPTALIGGRQMQLHSFDGYKLVGVNKYSDFPISSQALAYYLTNEASQKARYAERGAVPTNKAAVESDEIKNDPVLKAIEAQKPFTHVQAHTVSSEYWATDISSLGREIVEQKGNISDDELKSALHKIEGQIDN